MNFRKQMDYARPDVVERMAANAEKGELAMRLRGLRDAAGMTQEDIMLRSSLRMDEVEALEALRGGSECCDGGEVYCCYESDARAMSKRGSYLGGSTIIYGRSTWPGQKDPDLKN